jgi:hypothetical protein
MGTLDLIQNANKKNIADLNIIIPGEKVYFPKNLALAAKALGTDELTAQDEIVFIDQMTLRIPANESAAVEAPPAAGPILTVSQPVINNEMSQISVSLESDYSSINSNQNTGSATLLSKASRGFNLKWSQNWSENWQSFIGWGSNSVTFATPNQGTLLGGEKQTASRFGLGIIHKLSPSLKAAFETGTREEIFALSYSAGTATLETKPVNFFKLSFSKDFVEVRRLRLSGFFGGTYLLGLSGSSYDIKPGIEYYGGVRITHQLKSISIFASGEYSVTLQDTSLTTQSRKDIRTQIGVSIPLGADDSTKENKL